MQAWKARGKFKVGYVDVDWVEKASSSNGKNEAVQPYHVDPTQVFESSFCCTVHDMLGWREPHLILFRHMLDILAYEFFEYELQIVEFINIFNSFVAYYLFPLLISLSCSILLDGCTIQLLKRN